MLTGSPIRQELLLGNKLAGLELCGFTTDKPIIMVVGGSTGAVHVNEAVKDSSRASKKLSGCPSMWKRKNGYLP